MSHRVQFGIIAILLLAALSFVGAKLTKAAEPPPSEELQVFVRPGCPYCEAAKRFLPELQRSRPALRIQIRDIAADRRALADLQNLADRFGLHPIGVPAFYLRGKLIVGFDSAETTGRELAALLEQPAAQALATGPAHAIQLPLVGTVSLRRLGLPLFTIVLGLLDGFNPCAMWVLLFLLSMLINLSDRKKMFLIGGVFVAVSGLVYFAFMAAWLNIFFLIGMSRLTQLLLGAIALLVGSLNVKDYFAFGAGLSVGIPARAKPHIYRQVRQIIRAENLTGALAAVILLALLVNTVELLCTAGIPAIYTRVLTEQALPGWAYYGYLALYNLAYMADDSLMLAIAVVTLSGHKLQERGGRWLKLLSGIVMLALGLVLLLRPEWLGEIG
ncbi:MAG: glutaredoxin domain-containing protein [Candidatus Binatia bacterium]